MTDYLVPILLLGTSLFALRRQEDTYGLLLRGASDGLKMLVSIIPALVILLTAVTMLRASGAIDLLTKVFRPFLRSSGYHPKPLFLF